MMTKSEDCYSPESEKERAFSTFRNRVNLLNYCERGVNNKYVYKSILDTDVNTDSIDEMVNYILSTNKRIDEIREHLKLYGTAIQKHKLTMPLIDFKLEKQ